VRENGNKAMRTALFEKYKQEIEWLQTPFCIIKGQGKDRLQNAIECIDNFNITNNK
jgi:hypothetical protein